MDFFVISNTAFKIINYELSYVELFAVISGLVSVWYATRARILTWPTGVINEILLFLLFFQVQLYADMMLQVFFFITTVYGWINWNKPSLTNRVEKLSQKKRLYYAVMIPAGSLAAGLLVASLHKLLPEYFNKPASYPFIDSFVVVLSIAATLLLAKKKMENWICWIIVDLIAIVLYFVKGIYFLAIEYFVFLILATIGFYNWKRKLTYD
ncbi:MAG: nicotinamide riboside transporter PnuC [Chitinophagaceae bacterium]